MRRSMAKPMIGSGPFVQDLPDTFEFPYRREDADTKDTQEQPYDDHLSRLHMRARLRVLTNWISAPAPLVPTKTPQQSMAVPSSMYAPVKGMAPGAGGGAGPSPPRRGPEAISARAP